MKQREYIPFHKGIHLLWLALFSVLFWGNANGADPPPAASPLGSTTCGESYRQVVIVSPSDLEQEMTGRRPKRPSNIETHSSAMVANKLLENGGKAVGQGAEGTVYTGTMKLDNGTDPTTTLAGGTTDGTPHLPVIEGHWRKGETVAIKVARAGSNGGFELQVKAMLWTIRNGTPEEGRKYILRPYAVFDDEGHMYIFSRKDTKGHYSENVPNTHANLDPSNTIRGRYVLVTELADGGSLDDVLRKRNTDGKFLLDTIYKVSMGLEALHEMGYIHHDPKPANILFVKGQPKLGDFGAIALRNTDGQVIKGTARYAPRRQMEDWIRSKDSILSREKEYDRDTIDAEDSTGIALTSDDWHAMAVTLEEGLVSWALKISPDESPTVSAKDGELAVSPRVYDDPLPPEHRLSAYTHSDDEGGKKHHMYVPNKPIADIYADMKKAGEVEALSPQDEALLKMLSTVAWAKEHYWKTDPQDSLINGASQFRNVLRGVHAATADGKTNIQEFYRRFGRLVVEELEPTDAARLVFSDRGLTEAWEKGWITHPHSLQVVEAARVIVAEPLPGADGTTTSKPPITDVHFLNRSTPQILNADAVNSAYQRIRSALEIGHSKPPSQSRRR